MQLEQFNFELPDHLIARYPLATRSESRLLCLNAKTGNIQHHFFKDVGKCLQANDLLVLNDTKVIPARLYGYKTTGGKVEVLVERLLHSDRCLALLRCSKPPAINSKIILDKDISALIVARHAEIYELMLPPPYQWLNILETIGHIPLPPYLKREDEPLDRERYQTVFAKRKGAVAAPTAGLHFDNPLLMQLQRRGVKLCYITLHVGLGTFQPIRVENITQHKLHKEYLEVSPNACEEIKRTRKKGGRIIAVGTTCVRGLETAALSGEIKPFTGDTELFIYPGFKFHVVDALITNFHLPQSSLLMLVAALGGYENVMHAYQVAVNSQYRFFSYGDAMLIT